MTQLYSGFGVPVRIAGKYELPTGCYLVRLALVANGETDHTGRLIVKPEEEGNILHDDDKVAKGWTHDGELYAQKVAGHRSSPCSMKRP
jgi:hypothetical protein